MKLVFTSDTHCRHDKLVMPDGDILCHTGDATLQGRFHEIASFNRWLGEQRQRYKHILFTPGNHDQLFQGDPNIAATLLTNATVLIDRAVEIDGLRFYGSPWTPAFRAWSFMLFTDGQAEATWAKIPDHVDVLLTHGPPKGILDRVDRYVPMVHLDNRDGEELVVERVGCPRLMDRILQVKPQIHAFGHIHHQYGQQLFDGTHFINAAAQGDMGQLNPPIVVEL